MSKMRIIIMVLTLTCATLFCTQCKKEIVEQPVENISGETIEVSLNVSNGDGSKTEISPSGIVTWNTGDKIYVVCNDVTGETGGYLGFLIAQNGGGTSAHFTGTIKKTNLTHDFHFYYVGDNTFPTDGSNYSYNVSSQNGKLDTDNGIAKKHQIMHCSKEIESVTTNLGTISMRSMMAIANMKFSEEGTTLTDETITCKNAITSATLNIKTGELINKTTGNITLNNVNSGAIYYIALIPGEQTLKFTHNVKYIKALEKKDIVENTFYNEKSIEIGLYGALPELFSVANGKQVLFSKGNLQYIGSETPAYWKFAENQYNYIGGSTGTGQGSTATNVDRDWFGWGTSGISHGATCWEPWRTENIYSYYYAYGSWNNDLWGDGQGEYPGRADWGYNEISNGGNIQRIGWRVLTVQEWTYLLNTRTVNGGTGSGHSYQLTTITLEDGNTTRYGLLLLPDLFEGTVSSTTSWSDWQVLEGKGVAFLPGSGYRRGTDVFNVGSNGAYWSSTPYNDVNAQNLGYYDNDVVMGWGDRSFGYSVRLVRDAE